MKKGSKHSEETRKLISQKSSGVNHRNWGKHLSKETRDRISKANKGQVPWILGKHISEETKKKLSIANGGKNHYLWGKHPKKETIDKMRKAHTGENNHLWKGDKVGYWGLHKWVERHLGKPSHCAYCQTISAKKYDWANISHTYRRDLSDFIRLCSKCHKNYDLGNIKLLPARSSKEITK